MPFVKVCNLRPLLLRTYLGRFLCSARGDSQKVIHLRYVECAVGYASLPELIQGLESCSDRTRAHEAEGNLRASVGRNARLEELCACISVVS